METTQNENVENNECSEIIKNDVSDRKNDYAKFAYFLSILSGLSLSGGILGSLVVLIQFGRATTKYGYQEFSPMGFVPAIGVLFLGLLLYGILGGLSRILEKVDSL